MTDEQYRVILARIEECKSEASSKGHFWLLVMVFAIAVKTQAC